MDTTLEEVDQAAQEIRRSMLFPGDEMVDDNSGEINRKVSLTQEGFFDEHSKKLVYPGMSGKKASVELDKHVWEYVEPPSRAKTAPHPRNRATSLPRTSPLSTS